MDWLPLKTMDNPLPSAAVYLIQREEAVHIAQEMNVIKYMKIHRDGGRLRLASLTDIIVDEQGIIDGTGCMPPKLLKTRGTKLMSITTDL